jgi:hypothetical protein
MQGFLYQTICLHQTKSRRVGGLRTVLAALSAAHLPLQDLNRGLYTRQQRLCTGNSGFGLENVWGRMTRRQRRANIAAASTNDDAASATPLSKPDYGSRTTQLKTLYEIAAERQAQLQPDTPAFSTSSGNSREHKVSQNRSRWHRARDRC